jgi:hypothetical protein
VESRSFPRKQVCSPTEKQLGCLCKPVGLSLNDDLALLIGSQGIIQQRRAQLYRVSPVSAWYRFILMECDISIDGALRGSILTLISVWHTTYRSCVSVLEMQALLVALVENFEVSPPPSDLNVQIIRGTTSTVVPLVKGQEDRGAQMPLRVTAIN